MLRCWGGWEVSRTCCNGYSIRANHADVKWRVLPTESISEPFSDLERLRNRLRDIIGQRDRPPPVAPQPSQPGPSLDEELAAILRAGPPAPTRGIERPPELTPFVYRPAPRTSRPRSASPTLPPRPATVPIEAPIQTFDVPRRRPPRRPVSHTPVIPPPEDDRPFVPPSPSSSGSRVLGKSCMYRPRAFLRHQSSLLRLQGQCWCAGHPSQRLYESRKLRRVAPAVLNDPGHPGDGPVVAVVL